LATDGGSSAPQAQDPSTTGPDDMANFNLGVLTIATAGSVATRLERLDQLHNTFGKTGA
jgi:hypothetical protein